MTTGRINQVTGPVAGRGSERGVVVAAFTLSSRPPALRRDSRASQREAAGSRSVRLARPRDDADGRLDASTLPLPTLRYTSQTPPTARTRVATGQSRRAEGENRRRAGLDRPHEADARRQTKRELAPERPTVSKPQPEAGPATPRALPSRWRTRTTTTAAAALPGRGGRAREEPDDVADSRAHRHDAANRTGRCNRAEKAAGNPYLGGEVDVGVHVYRLRRRTALPASLSLSLSLSHDDDALLHPA